MKLIITHLICVSLLLGIVASCAKQATTEEKTLYTCSMHPQVVQDHPGNCPICGMKLLPMRKQATPAALAAANPSGGGKDRQAGGAGNRKIKYYKSTMLLGEISQTP